MLIGVPREIKDNEYRVGLTAASVRELVARGHAVVVESGAGAGIGLGDDDYERAGAQVVDSADEVFARAEMIVKVKEPQAAERRLLRPGQILFAYLHLAPDAQQARELLASGAVCIAYETVTGPGGTLPLLAPMSEVAGRMAVQAGAACLEKPRGGRGVLLGGVPGVEPARVAILGAGVVGANAALMAAGAGAQVTVLNRSVEPLRALAGRLGTRVHTVVSTGEAIEAHVMQADLVIGAVLIPGAAAPKLVSAQLVKAMKPGSVIVDVAIDQGGCCETSRPTTHSQPTYVIHDVVHYCVANMPGALPRTSTYALNNATLPLVLRLADAGWRAALACDAHLRDGLNIAAGKVTHPGVAAALGHPLHEAQALVGPG